jgi:hypothetical protein
MLMFACVQEDLLTLPQQLSASELGAAFDAAWADAQSQQLTTGTRASLRSVLYKLNARQVTLCYSQKCLTTVRLAQLIVQRHTYC